MPEPSSIRQWTMHYISTRGANDPVRFDDIIVAGLAPDGGLYVPATLPQFSRDDIAAFASRAWPEVALAVLRPFVGGTIPDAALYQMIMEAAATFDDARVAPLSMIEDGLHVMELFHGPTLAFKDVALQWLGRLIDWRLRQRGKRAVILGATSGDTGSAAIAALKGLASVKVVILHPRGRTSDVQRRQMTTASDANVFNLAVEGTFDDTQAIVKSIFADADFSVAMNLGAINSINWARIAAQTVYYVTASATLSRDGGRIDFSVPTGNFGDIYAGIIARAMGAPIGRLIIAANENDILVRTVQTGTYALRQVVETTSPSMDIQVSSNFERLLFDISDRKGDLVAGLMADLKRTGAFTLEAPMLARLREAVSAERVTMDQAATEMASLWRSSRRLIDPHTAIGLVAARRQRRAGTPMVALATAHAAKFPDVVARATGTFPTLPERIRHIMTAPERMTTIAADAGQVKAFIRAATETWQ